MESGNGSAWSKGALVPVSTTSDAFQSNIVAPLKSAYLYEESKQSFRYKSAVLIKNPELEKKYNAFRTKRRQLGYSEEDLEESYGFLLFEDVNKANALGETGVLTGNSTCTTLGDPSNGVYISVYSDCLDQNRWYHGKSGYIAIIKLTKGKVKKVLENYTQNFTAPTEGFDCHVSEQFPSVSCKTSSFLAFERTQYYMYELLDNGSNETVQSPGAACPFAIVSFSYTDTKATLEASQEKSVVKKLVWYYFPWRGQLQIGSREWDVGLRSTAGALMPSELPPVVKVDRAIAMLDLKQLLPGAVFESCFTGEAFLDGLHCSLCEFVSSPADQASSLSQLLWEIKEKDIALTIPLSDSGFLILLHSSHFLTYDDSGNSASEVLQGMFVFPDSRVIHPDTKFGQRKPAMSSEILRVLPVLSYAEAEVEKTPTDPSEELCEVFVQHMQNYAALINPGLASSPSRDLSIFPDEYDVPDAHKHLYSSPEWTNRAWQNLTSYLSKPDSFQLPVSKATEILAAGQVEQMEDLVDDVYFCLSSPEEVPANPVDTASEDQLTGQKSSLNVETSVDSCISSEAQVVPQGVAPDDLQLGDDTKDTEKSDLALPIKSDDTGTKTLLAPSTSDDPPAELIVSITSAERTVTDGRLSVISSDSATKHNDFQLSGFSTTKVQTSSVNSLDDETVAKKKDFECPPFTNLTKTKRRKPLGGHFRVRKHVSKACVETPCLQPVKIPLEVDNLQCQKEEQDKESSDDPQLINPSNIDWRKVRRRKRIFGKLSSKKVRTATVGPTVAEQTKSDLGQESFESTILRELEACPLRKKMERWDLKPVISECGRILVPHGSVDIVDRIKALKDKGQSGKDEAGSEKMSVDESVDDHDTVKMEPESSTAPETTEVTAHKSEGNLPQNVDVIHNNPNHSILRQLDDGSVSSTLKPENSEHASKTEVTGSPSIKTIQEKHVDNPSPEKRASKGEVLLNKLKSVLQRGKRKTITLVAEERTGTAQDTEPFLKKGKVDSYSGLLESNDVNATVRDSSLGVKGISVDPLFAYALGLTPKETQNKIHKPEDQDTQQWKGSSETQEQTILHKQPQIIQRPLSIFPRRGRIKTLKKHQGISTECVKKKWWLHFQTPACFDSEKLKYKQSIRDSSVRKTEKSNTDCSPTDALSLLADLALSASNGQVPPQPDPAVEREPETSLKKSDLAKDVTSGEQESVLHALLRQPVARPIQPLEPPPSSHLVGERELVGLISKEHAYSLPPSSSLLSDLSGAPFQVSPLSGSTRLLHHHQTMYGDGIKALHPSVNQEDRGEHNRSAPEHLKKRMVRRRKFRHSRTIVNNDGSVQVTKQWKENYDFNLDSKFTTDPKHRAIIRALHGPWDLSIQDTTEDLRLIIHMWIGLFYSRSTARFFHLDSDCANPCSGDSDCLEMPTGMVPATIPSELKDNAFVPCPDVTETSDNLISKALDLSKKDNSVLDQGSVILDLSVRNSNAENATSDPQVYKNTASVSGELKEARETSNTLKSSMELQKCYRNSAQYTDSICEVTDDRSTCESERTMGSLPKDGCLEQTDVPSLKDGGSLNFVQEVMESASVQPEHQQTASGIDRTIHGRDNEETDMKDGVETSEATEMCLVQKQERDLSTCLIDKELHSNKIVGDVIHTTERDETESKDVEDLEVKEKPYQGSNTELSPETMHTSNDSTNEEPSIVCNGNLLEDEKQFSSDEGKAVSTCKAEHLNEDVDCCAVRKDEEMEDDHLVKEDGAYQKTLSISDVDTDRDLSDQALPMTCDGSDSLEKDCFTDCSRQAPLEPPPTDSEEDACHDLQLRKLCSNGSGLTDEKIPHIPPENESIRNKPAVQENSENSTCLADLCDPCEDPDSVKDCITVCNDQAPLDEEPPQAGSRDACRDLQVLTCRSKCTNDTPLTGEHVKSDKIPHTPSEMEPIHNEATVEENPGIHVCLLDTAHHQKAALCMSDDSYLSFDGSSADGSSPQTNDNVETEIQNQVTPNFNLRRNDHEDQDPKSVERRQTVESTTQKLFNHESHSPQGEAVTGCKAKVALTEETDLKRDKINGELEMIHGRVVIPFIGIDTSGDDAAQPHDPDSEGKIEEAQGQRETTFISETAYPETGLSTEECSTSQMCSKKIQQSAGKTSPSVVDVSEAKRPEVSGCESDDRCPTPTIDEEPYWYATHGSSSSNTLTDELPLWQKCKSPVKSALNSDLELRTLRVLQSINKFFDKSDHTEKSSQIKTADMKQTDKLQETSGGQDYSHRPRSFPSAEYLQALKPVTESPKQKNQALSQTNVSQEPRTFSQRPVMAVKPSKSDEVQAGCNSKDRDVSKNKPTQTLIFSDTTATSMLSQKTTESCKGNSAEPNDEKQEARELLSKISCLSNASDSKVDSDQVKFAHLDPLLQREGRSISKFNTIPSSSLAPSSLIQSPESPKTSELVDGNQSFWTNSLVERAGQTTRESFGMDHKDCSDPSTSAAEYRVESIIDDSPLGPENSLTCTVFNTGQERSETFLEQLSKRCLQDDLTQASVERECLIFSEQMKQLLKSSKRDPIHQADKFNLSCLSPVTVHFSILEEQESSVVHSDTLSVIGQKIHVDMSDRKGTTDEENILLPPKLSETSGNPVEHAGVSGVTAECARVYTARMNDVCAVKKVPCRSKHLRMDGGHPMTEPRNHFDFCDQMKREMDESFRSNLNSVVKKSCKTKYRFYILVTSDDPFFEETKAQLAAEGHTAVQPSDFFLAEDHSSSLLIILRNEDIAEHICEVPHLLELKKSAGVQFAGIDEPDDVVNLTHQELFMRGGFIMFDRAALESLSICDMKKMAEILQELSRTGKWKWTLHYRDSRRLKENARLSAEAKEKKDFLNWCQEVGILEILPYHECDLTSSDQPDYLTCLVRLQVQNISARYPVFVTDSTAGSSFGPNGILTMTCSSILTCSPSKTFAV